MASRKTDKVIAHFLDGSLLRGSTPDFYPSRGTFRLCASDGETHEVEVGELKALFFVKDLRGRPSYRERKGFFKDSEQGSKVMVEFYDGEVIFGYSLAYSPKGLGFFLVPGDPESNNLKVFVVRSSTKRIKVKTAHNPPKKKKDRRKRTRLKSRA